MLTHEPETRQHQCCCAGTEIIMLDIISSVIDRCDRCGAFAQIHTVLPAGGELLFCGHHATQYLSRLCQLDAVIETYAAPVQLTANGH